MNKSNIVKTITVAMGRSPKSHFFASLCAGGDRYWLEVIRWGTEALAGEWKKSGKWWTFITPKEDFMSKDDEYWARLSCIAQAIEAGSSSENN